MRELLDASGVAARVSAMADAIHASMTAFEQERGAPSCWAVVGIRKGGVELADRLVAALAERGRKVPERGDVDITLYRDDLYTGLERPVLGATELPFEVTRAGLWLVDDVLFTGRTIRAALGEIHDFGRPAVVRLAVLVDRGHREVPIAADVAGMVVQTRLRDRVMVELARGGGPGDRVVMEERPSTLPGRPDAG